MNNQQRLICTNELSVENPEIDNEHKELIRIYNDLVGLDELKVSRDEFAKILSRMTDYCLTRFREEEKYMERLNYPKLAEHKNLHRDFIYKVTMYNNELSQYRLPDPKEMIDFLSKWWSNHILRDDKDFECFRKKLIQ